MTNLSLLMAVMVAIVAHSRSARRTVSSRQWPQSLADESEYEFVGAPSVEWSCTFDRHDCGIVNDPHVGLYFERRNSSRQTFYGKSSMLWLNTSRTGNTAGARLITPYYQTKNHTSGCLSLEYLIHGSGIEKITIYQQDKDNLCLWQTENEQLTDKWKRLSLTIDLKNGSPRFFIQTQTDNRPPKTGIFAISEITFDYRKCSSDQTNYCGTIRTHNGVNGDTEDYFNDLP